MRRLATIALIATLATAACSPPAPAYDFRTGYERRAVIIASEAAQIAPGQLAVIGDSIVERQRLTRLCGLDALNAGTSSAKAADVAELALSAALAARPSRAVLAVGTNDWREDRAVDVPAWQRTVASMIDRLPPRPIVVGIGALPGTDAQALAAANAFLRREATRRGGSYVEPLPTALTSDGVHPSLAGMREWQARVERACQGT